MSQNEQTVVTLKFVDDLLSEFKLVESGVCTFTAMDHVDSAEPLLTVSTMMSDPVLATLPAWSINYPGCVGQPTRYNVRLSKKALEDNLRAVYGKDSLLVME